MSEIENLEYIPECPNCSNSHKKFYMRPISDDLIKRLKSNYECSKCDFRVFVKNK